MSEVKTPKDKKKTTKTKAKADTEAKTKEEVIEVIEETKKETLKAEKKNPFVPVDPQSLPRYGAEEFNPAKNEVFLLRVMGTNQGEIIQMKKHAWSRLCENKKQD